MDALSYQANGTSHAQRHLQPGTRQRTSDLRTTIDKVEKAIDELVEPKPTTRTSTAAKGTKRFFLELSDDDEEADVGNIDIPHDLSKFRDWVAVHHSSWDAAGLPGHDEDILEKYNISHNINSDKSTWPTSI